MSINDDPTKEWTTKLDNYEINKSDIKNKFDQNKIVHCTTISVSINTYIYFL